MEQNFSQFLAAVRAGDQQAASELVRRYEPYLRGIIRMRLQHAPLRRLLDSMDICQSVLALFFARAAQNRFDIQTPEQLARLLARMAVRKFLNKARRQGNHPDSLPAGWDLIDPEPSSARQIDSRDLLDAVRTRLTAEELDLFEQNKVQGRTWAEIAAESDNKDPDALRMRLARALVRVRRELQTEDERRVP
jgi:DNA-directed RNA polymerase specialized sigma24 family protein